MLGFVLIYFIGKYFYDLALQYGKNKWLFAILGVVSYYAGTIIFGFSLGIIMELTGNYSILEANDILLSLMGIPVGVLTVWIFYTLLKNSWKKAKPNESSALLDDTNLDF